MWRCGSWTGIRNRFRTGPNKAQFGQQLGSNIGTTKGNRGYGARWWTAYGRRVAYSRVGQVDHSFRYGWPLDIRLLQEELRRGTGDGSWSGKGGGIRERRGESGGAGGWNGQAEEDEEKETKGRGIGRMVRRRGRKREDLGGLEWRVGLSQKGVNGQKEMKRETVLGLNIKDHACLF